jgi:hypothetical protein
MIVGAAGTDASSSFVVRANGQIGPLRIDVTSEAQVRAFAGKPAKVENQFFPPKKAPIGRTLYYGCGRGCRTAYSINNATGRLSDFWTQSPRFVTAHGSRAGMSATRVAALEGKKLLPGCGEALYMHLRWDSHRSFVLSVRAGRVEGMTYLGPHSVYYDGLC